jgi:tetratricopeptide (TPR) repeat protein
MNKLPKIIYCFAATILLLLFFDCGKTGGYGDDDLRRFSHLPLVQEIDSLTWLAEDYQWQRSEKCYAVFEVLEKKLAQLGDSNILPKVNVYALMGNFYYQCNNYEQAITYFKKILQFPFDIRYFVQYMGAQINVGCAHMEMNELDSAAVYFQRIIDEQRGHENPQQLENCKMVAGRRQLTLMTTIAQQLENCKVVARTNLARIYIAQGKYKETIPYLKHAIEHMYIHESHTDIL